MDVDETYREPLLGEAFYHEKALTISRVCAVLFHFIVIQRIVASKSLGTYVKMSVTMNG